MTALRSPVTKCPPIVHQAGILLLQVLQLREIIEPHNGIVRIVHDVILVLITRHVNICKKAQLSNRNLAGIGEGPGQRSAYRKVRR